MMELWITRDKDKTVQLHVEKPRKTENGFFSSTSKIIGKIIIPSLTWENSPQRIILKPENNGNQD